MSFLRNAVSVVTTQVAITPVALVTGILLARLLSVHDRGLYAVATALAAVTVLLAQLGWPATAIYRLRRLRADPAAVAGAALCIGLACSLLAVALCLAWRGPLLERFLSGASPRVLALALASVPFQVLGLLFAGVARGLDRFDLHNRYLLSLAVLTLAALAAVLGLHERSAPAALSALLGVHALTSLVLVARVARHAGLRLRISWREATASLPFGLKTHAQTLLLHLHQHADVFLLAWLLEDPAQVGLYAVAVGVVNRTRLLPASVALSLFPAVAGLDARESARFVARVLRHSLLWSGVTVGVLLPSGPVLVPLCFGSRYEGSVAAFLLLLPGMLGATLYLVLARYFTARNRHAVNITTQGISSLANVALNLWLIPRHGIAGAALASLGSYSLQGGLALRVFLQESGRDLREALLPGRAELLAYPRQLTLWSRRLRDTS
jgi:O-antigen/teichoic acid export membrane protein